MRGSNCTRPKCWYYNYVVQQFTDAGVFTNIVDGKVYCLAHHLSGFTLRTGKFTDLLEQIHLDNSDAKHKTQHKS